MENSKLKFKIAEERVRSVMNSSMHHSRHASNGTGGEMGFRRFENTTSPYQMVKTMADTSGLNSTSNHEPRNVNNDLEHDQGYKFTLAAQTLSGRNEEEKLDDLNDRVA